MSAPLSPESILGTTGRIAQRLKSYEQRPEQLQMAPPIEPSQIARHDYAPRCPIVTFHIKQHKA